MTHGAPSPAFPSLTAALVTGAALTADSPEQRRRLVHLSQSCCHVGSQNPLRNFGGEVADEAAQVAHSEFSGHQNART